MSLADKETLSKILSVAKSIVRDVEKSHDKINKKLSLFEDNVEKLEEKSFGIGKNKQCFTELKLATQTSRAMLPSNLDELVFEVMS
ncbi:hypothetical protein [Candidatus Ichthyocystis hellenicum]|uniref:hypothetical protein n=1 Tax=Candidatus Ichthyocystis hellenicum TaxID=1561003 RepID=UPI000B86A31A|nr:hypothetical protein [Candidatus Ichthyocystis hellenicum]